MHQPTELAALIIDDDRGDAELLERHLGKLAEWNFEVAYSNSAEEGLSALQTASVDLVFLDYQLGKADGVQVLKAIRERGDLLPVIVVTGRGDEYAAADLTRAGADDYIVKGDLSCDALRRSIGYARAKYRQRLAESEVEQTNAKLTEAHAALAANHATLEAWAADLEAANRRLQQLDDLKTRFLSEVSHELRTPMASIVSAAKIIRKHHAAKPDVVKKFTATILSEGDRLTRLVDNFLDLTKIESGCMQWNDQEVRVEHLVAEAMNGAAALAAERGVKLTAQPSDGLPALHVDRDRYMQVLTNLLSNALKFTPRGGTVSLEAVTDFREVEFRVSDTGDGIPPSQLERIFDRFHQVTDEAGRSAKRGGTGIGLAVCKEVVEHYRGRIWVESALGEGSVFKFTVPVRSASASATTNAAGSALPQ